MPEPDFIRMKEAARRLGIGADVVRDFEQRGLLPAAIRPGTWHTATVDGKPRRQYRGVTLFPLAEFNLYVERLKRRTRFNKPKTKPPTPPAEEPDATDRPDAPQG